MPPQTPWDKCYWRPVVDGEDLWGLSRQHFSINLAAADYRRSNRLIAFARTGYVCPRCKSRCSDLPSDHALCGLMLILALHLARTFHHLFPVRPFEELDEAHVLRDEESDGDATMHDANGDKTNGNKGLEALPIISSSAFTPIASTSSSAAMTFVVSSAISNTNEKQNDSHSNHDTTNNSKIINIGPSLVAKSTGCDWCCFGCLKIIRCQLIATADEVENKELEETTEAILRFQCPECLSFVRIAMSIC